MVFDDERSAGVACFGLITDESDRVLLVRQSYGQQLWALPGGMALPGESLLQTAYREIVEETGISAELEDLITVADRGTVLLVVFRGTTTQTRARAQEGEISECRWFTPAELSELGSQAFDLAMHVAQHCVDRSGLSPVLLTGGGDGVITFVAGRV